MKTKIFAILVGIASISISNLQAQCGANLLYLDNQSACDIAYLVFFDNGCNCTDDGQTGTINSGNSACISIGCNCGNPSTCGFVPWKIRVDLINPSQTGVVISCPGSFPSTSNLSTNCAPATYTQLRWESLWEAYVEDMF